MQHDTGINTPEQNGGFRALLLVTKFIRIKFRAAPSGFADCAWRSGMGALQFEFRNNVLDKYPARGGDG
jgi:hypothetical protein